MASTTAAKSGSSFGQTLQFITSIKLQELEKQRLAYYAHAKIIDEAKILGDKGDIIAKVELLAKAVKSWTGSGSLPSDKIVGGKLEMRTLEFWLQQAKKDPSFSHEIAQGWAETLEAHIKHTGMRFDCAKLFGTLFNEWLASGDSSAMVYQAGDDSADVDSMASNTSSDFVDIGRKEMYEQKEKLESIIFDDHPVDVEELKAYLEGLFESEDAGNALDRLRKELKDQGYSLQRKPILRRDVAYAIKGLLASGLMDEEKRTTLKAFQENPTVLDEVASVLNMRMAGLDSWAWPKEGILVEMRRHLNGKYRAFTDPEIIDALLLHHIGVAWQVKLKSSLRRLFDGKAWNRSFVPPTHKVKERWTEQLRGDDGSSSIESRRHNTRKTHFFLSQLTDEASRPSRYDDLVDAPEQDDGTISPAVVKQKLLHIMTTECYLNKALDGTHAVIRSDLEWFGPSLPHTSILTVLEFLGMPRKWLSFYKAFLAAPLKFSDDSEARVRKRGTPISYALSVVCGEAILFIMDFAVNQRADGLYLYRMHDDLWLWDADAKKCATGWAEMNKYAGLVGLKFNERKTGSAFVGNATSTEASGLPKGDIRWGFLKFDPTKSRFVIDQEDVNHHIVELRRQLAATKSVFGWVNAYNKYMAFFLRNFGGIPANCVGQEHVVDIVDTLGRIQRELFPASDSHGSGAVGYLRKVLEERFGVSDLPEGYFYFPISSGGLELRNTLLEILALQKHDRPLVLVSTKGIKEKEDKKLLEDDDSDSVSEDDTPDWDSDDSDDECFHDEDHAAPEERFTLKMVNDRKSYKRIKEVWDSDERRGKNIYVAPDLDQFMSFDEYISLRKSWISHWGSTYKTMLESPEVKKVAPVPSMRVLMDCNHGLWTDMNWYDQWVTSMYGEEVVKKFGGLEVVDPDLIPIGMVQLFKTSRMKLDQ